MSTYNDISDKSTNDYSGARPETEPILAWRAWRIFPPGILLSMSSLNFVWMPRAPIQAMGGPITMESFAGFWAYKKKSQLIAEYGSSIIGVDSVSDIYRVGYGQVWLWGSVVEHKLGYRAEYAYPASLYVLSHIDLSYIPMIGELYGVPVLREDMDMKEYLSSHKSKFPVPFFGGNYIQPALIPRSNALNALLNTYPLKPKKP